MKKQDRGTLETEEKSELKHLRKMKKAHEELLIKHDLLKNHSILFGSKKIFRFIDSQRDHYYFHSDRGSEYVALKYQNWLKKNGVIQSMNRKSVMNDNAEMESFFHQYKAERFHKNEYATEKELCAMIIEYIGFYNHKRIHSSLGYLSPDDYEVAMG